MSYLIDSIPRSRVLILLTLRPGHDLAPAERTYATRLVLRNLTAEEAAEMTAAVLTSADLPAELHALVQRKAEGNPFFVEELIKSLERDRGDPSATASAGCSVGRSIRSLSRTRSRTC